ncbi:hypothetical protein chiPu_0024883 [Chiloscyllium punctatum]|uniref:Uncharacterized protein n=1 Tax=Chiloscyllium punctatum TaxID=137246 RepID=A0A401TDC0_CHIPU|nr:hypothetical protein [Chiloscyllium punctatum]
MAPHSPQLPPMEEGNDQEGGRAPPDARLARGGARNASHRPSPTWRLPAGQRTMAGNKMAAAAPCTRAEPRKKKIAPHQDGGRKSAAAAQGRPVQESDRKFMFMPPRKMASDADSAQ